MKQREFADQEFMLQLYTDYERLLFATARSFTDNREDQEDIVQTALLRLMSKTDTLRRLDAKALDSYVVFTVKSVAINQWRRRQIIDRHCAAIPDSDTEESALLAPSPEDRVLQWELRDRVGSFLERLSETDRILLMDKYILEETDREIAAELGCKPSSIRMMLTRARRKALAMILEEGGSGHDGI